VPRKKTGNTGKSAVTTGGDIYYVRQLETGPTEKNDWRAPKIAKASGESYRRGEG